jgi:hypothetical protein
LTSKFDAVGEAHKRRRCGSDVVGLEQQIVVAYGFRMCATPGGDHGKAVRHRLNNAQPERFCWGGREQNG